MDISTYSLTELRRLQGKIEAEIRRRSDTARKDLLKRMQKLAAEHGMSLNEVRTFAGQFSDSLLALYYPWVVTADPSGVRPELTVPPGGFIAGVLIVLFSIEHIAANLRGNTVEPAWN